MLRNCVNLILSLSYKRCVEQAHTYLCRRHYSFVQNITSHENPTMFKLFLVYIIVHHVAVGYGGSSLCNSGNYYDQKLEICATECCGRSCPDECRYLFCLCNIGCCNNDPCKICYQPTVQPMTPSYCSIDEDCAPGFCDQQSYKCSRTVSPTGHGSVETTVEPAEDELFVTFRSSSASFHLTTVKIVLIFVGCLFLLVSVVIIAFILNFKRRHSWSKQALLPETVITSSTSTKSVPQ